MKKSLMEDFFVQWHSFFIGRDVAGTRTNIHDEEPCNNS